MYSGVRPIGSSYIKYLTLSSIFQLRDRNEWNTILLCSIGRVMTIFKSNPFHPDSNLPLYQALYAHMRTAILSGELKGGMKLPSTRALAEELNISRNTVLNTYRQLLAEGYLESREGSGTYVAHVLPELLLTAPHPNTSPANQVSRSEPPQPLFSERAKAQITAYQPP